MVVFNLNRDIRMSLAYKSLPIWLFAALISFIVIKSHSAPPVRDKVLEEVQIVRSDGNVIIEVHFSFPMRYLSHFPQESGESLRIRLRPVRVPSSDANAVFRREGVVPRYADTVAVDEVIYEGDAPGGPLLTLNFTRPVSYRVIAGSDYRSISIVMVSVD